MIAEGHILDTGDGISLRDSVYKIIKQAIMTGELAPDERLMEIPIANKLGVSRTPVREAVKRLEKEQLVIINPRCGARVAAITDKDVTDALEVRLSVENMAVRLAVHCITPEQIARLRKYNESMAMAVRNNDISGISEADYSIHRIICESTGNNVLMTIMGILEEHVIRFRVEDIRSTVDYAQLLQEHNELIAALEQRDEDGAAIVITKHISNQLGRIRRIIQQKAE